MESADVMAADGKRRRRKLLIIAAVALAAAAILDWTQRPEKQASVRIYQAVVITPYQFALRPALSTFIRCRYKPTCSQYSSEAVRAYGFPIGAWMTTKRLFRCMPWVPFGTSDPVPPPHKPGIINPHVVVPAITCADLHTLDAAVALLQRQLAEHEIVTAEDRLRAVVSSVISDARNGFMLLAGVDGRSFGIAYAAAHLSAEHGGVVGWLEELYVLPELRSRGVGSALLREVIARAEELQWRALELEVVAGHERAVPLYQRHQFRAASRARFTRPFAA